MTKRVSDCRMIWRDNNCGAQHTEDVRFLGITQKDNYLVTAAKNGELAYWEISGLLGKVGSE